MPIKIKSLKNFSKKKFIIADEYIRQAGIMSQLVTSFLFALPYDAYNYWKKWFDFKFHFYIFYTRKEFIVFYNKSATKDLADFVWQRHFRHKKWLDKVYQDWEKEFREMKILGKEIYQKDLTNLSNKTLRNYLKRVHYYSRVNWGIGFLAEAYDEFWQDILKHVFAQEKVKTPLPSDLSLLLTSVDLPFLTIAEQELIRIKKQRNLTQRSKLIKKFINKKWQVE